ncbi:MAG: hypothetical protein ACLFQY_06100 [Desulfococcaceae bacterium]
MAVNIGFRSLAAVGTLFFLFFLGGCQGNFPGYRGELVAEENRAPLQSGGPHSGVWNTDDLVVQYRYIRQGGTLDLTGNIELVGGAANFQTVKRFSLSVYFVDGNGRILEQALLFGAGGGRQIYFWSFEKEMQPPPDTRSMAFGYSGVVRGSGHNAGTWSFWETPI